MASSPAASTSSSVSARSAAPRSIILAPATSAKSRTPRNLIRALRRDADTQHARAAIDDVLELRLRVEIQSHGYAETVAQRIGEEPRARGCADERELRQVDPDRTRRRPLSDDQIELKILHGGIE